MNQSELEGKWKDIKGEIRTRWGDLTDDELEKTKGNIQSLAGLIQEKYGTKKEQITERLGNIFKQFGSFVGETTEGLKNAMRDSQKKQHTNS